MDSGLLQNAQVWQVFSWCLLKASHKPIKQMVGFQIVELEPGQFVFGRKSAAAELKSSQQTIRTCMEKLKKLEILTIKPTNKFSIVTIVNWETYQQDKGADNQQANHHLTSSQPASNQQVTTNKNVKNIRTEEEYKKLPASDDAERGNGKPFYVTKKKKKLSGWKLDSFNRFWGAFNYMRGKAEAADAWLEIRDLDEALAESIILAAEKEASRRQAVIERGGTPKMAQGWLSGRRWEDEHAPTGGASSRYSHKDLICMAASSLKNEGEAEFSDYCQSMGIDTREVKLCIEKAGGIDCLLERRGEI